MLQSERLTIVTMKAFPFSATCALIHANTQDVLDSGNGFGTYYYDVSKVQSCGSDFSNQNMGYVECSHVKPLPLNEINSNYIVAMNHSLLTSDLTKYCGKRVVVTIDGRRSDLPLFIGDGCERCSTGIEGAWDAAGAPGLDFSYSVLNELTSSACAAGHVSISWEIVNETLHDFDMDEGHNGLTLKAYSSNTPY